VTDHLKSGATAWATAKHIRKRIHDETELTASAGISYNKFLAKLASDQQKPNGQFAIMPDEGEAFVASLPVAKFHGVGRVTTAKMDALGIETGADLRRQTLVSCGTISASQGTGTTNLHEVRTIGRSSPTGSESPPDRRRPSRRTLRTRRGSKQAIAMADEVWSWCEKAKSRGRTVTVKIKWADFQISTRRRSLETTIETRDRLREVALDLIRSVLPPIKGIRLVGVTLSNFRPQKAGEGAELPFREV
jgi:DNA polymerase IV